MNKFILILASLLMLSACVSTKSNDILLDHKVSGPKIIAMSGTRAPWVYEIEKRLKSQGFQIKRMASQNVAVEQVSETKKEAYNEAAARFILHIDGYAPNTSMTRSYNFV